MRFRLGRATAQALGDAGIAFAVIGAAAMPLYGYTRATMDLDLLVFDRQALRADTWAALAALGAPVEIRVSDDDDDPVIGVVRVGRAGRRQCDVVMPRGGWHRDVIARAIASGPTLRVDRLDLPAVTLIDLIALKLDAGGPLDLRDVHELLNVRPEAEGGLVQGVGAVVEALSARTREAWSRVVRERQI